MTTTTTGNPRNKARAIARAIAGAWMKGLGIMANLAVMGTLVTICVLGALAPVGVSVWIIGFWMGWWP